MNFLKSMLPLSSQKTLIKSTKDYDFYRTIENNVTLSIFKYQNTKLGINAIETLKTLKHPNIIGLVKTKTEKNNTYFMSEEVFCLQDCYDESLVFNFYSLCVLADVLVFLKRCNISHNNLGFSCLFYNANSKVIVGNFEAAGNKNQGNDNFAFTKMVEKVKKDFGKVRAKKQETPIKIHRIVYKKEVPAEALAYKKIDVNPEVNNYYMDMLNATYDGFEDFYESNKPLYDESIYKKFETFVMKFKVLTTDEKLGFIDFLKLNKDNWIEINKIKAIDMFMDDIGTDNEYYKDQILYAILYLNLKSYDKQMNILFCIPDSQLRTFLTANIDNYIDKVTNWDDKIFDSVCLGIKCSDDQLKYDSIVFFGKTSKFISEKNFKELVKLIYTHIKDDKTIEESLLFCKANFDRISTSKIIREEVYRFLVAFLSYSDTRNMTLSTLSKFYKIFDVKKLQLEMIPVLCTLLADKHNQDLCFDLIERIVQHLKENKAKLCVENWSVKKIGKVMNKLSFKIPRFSSSKSKSSTSSVIDQENDWEGEW